MTRPYPAEYILAHADPRVIAGLHKAADELKASDLVRLSLFATAIVEANLKNPTGGDRDSVGCLQQRRGWGPLKARMEPYLAALAYLKDAQLRVLPAHPGYSAGVLAQAVQRSAFPNEYTAALRAAQYVMDMTKGEINMEWHLAPSLKALLREVDARWPKRDKSWDGTIGDASHAARHSEHNPDHDADPMPWGAVSAADITKDSAAMIEAVRKALVADDRTWYVIHNGHIWSRTHNFERRTYSGSNSHLHHLHVSLRQTKEAHDNTGSWGIKRAADKPEPPSPTHKLGSRELKPGSSGADVAVLQRFLGHDLVDDGEFGPATLAQVRRYQGDQGMDVTGVITKAQAQRIALALGIS